MMRLEGKDANRDAVNRHPKRILVLCVERSGACIERRVERAGGPPCGGGIGGVPTPGSPGCEPEVRCPGLLLEQGCACTDDDEPHTTSVELEQKPTLCFSQREVRPRESRFSKSVLRSPFEVAEGVVHARHIKLRPFGNDLCGFGLRGSDASRACQAA